MGKTLRLNVVILLFCGFITGVYAQSPTPNISLLPEFRQIGGKGNNLPNPALDVVPNTPELNLTPLQFASGPDNPLIEGPDPRTISNFVAGGTGSGGHNAQTTDPVASAWLYVFGQFVDHDLDLEETPLTSTDISINVPAGNPTFLAGTSIAMTRDSRDPTTNNIINTTAGYLDLSSSTDLIRRRQPACVTPPTVRSPTPLDFTSQSSVTPL